MTRLCSIFAILLVAGMLAPSVHAQQPDSDYPRAEDVGTLDGIIKAYYDVVSGAEGEERDWARDRSLHVEDALVSIVRTGDDGKPEVQTMSLGDYHDSSGTAAFYEYEINRVVESWASTTHVWSTYAWKTDPHGPVQGRGINSIQLYNDGDRWWIVSWMFDGTGDQPPIPGRYLPEDLR